MKKLLLNGAKDFLFAVLAGISISIGCMAFLSASEKFVGALFFTVGLFVIVNFKFNLFTGKVCYVFDNKPVYLMKLLVIWIGNLAGTLLTAVVLRGTRLESLSLLCEKIVEVKLGDNLLSLFVLGIFCNILIYVAVEGFAKFDSPVLKALALIFGVSVFVLCGFEHCVADMFYFAFAKMLTGDAILRLLVITAGNCVGGLLIPSARKIYDLIDKKAQP